MLSRRWKGFMEQGRFVPTMGKAWVKARKHDRFYRAAKKQSYPSRAAIKLSQIHLRYGLFEQGDVVVDLGAAPGGWSQIARERIGADGRVLAGDHAAVREIERARSKHFCASSRSPRRARTSPRFSHAATYSGRSFVAFAWHLSASSNRFIRAYTTPLLFHAIAYFGRSLIALS